MIDIQNVSFQYKDTPSQVLKDMTLKVRQGEFLCLIGHSGCGKSTLIRLMAGLNAPTEGRILARGTVVQGPNTDRAVVFQQYTLFPWQKVWKNVLFAVMKTRRYSKEEAVERATFFLKKTGMYEHRDKYPGQLSGGMRQRTAIARALAMGSEILLLDEPFGALDVQNRTELQKLLYSLWKEEKKTIIFVTHDLDEALKLGSRIVFLKEGRIQRELELSEDMHRSCAADTGEDDIKALRAELEAWYQ